MAEQTQNKGFKIPSPTPTKEQPVPAPAAVPTPTPSSATPQSNSNPQTGTSIPVPAPSPLSSSTPQPRDYAIAGGVLMVLLIAFFFAKKAYANHLARKQVSPGAANSAGWWLFIFLTGLATAAILSFLNPAKFMTPMIMGLLLAISLVALILMLITGRRS